MVAAGAALLAACFDPVIRDDLACGPQSECPPDYACSGGICRPDTAADGGAGAIDGAVGRDGPVPDARPGRDGPMIDAPAKAIDASVADAATPDAPVPDAAIVGCTGPSDCMPPNPCLLPGTCGEDGLCIFAEVDCSHLDSQCAVGACRLSDGVCTAQPAHGGDSCGAGTTCSESECSYSGLCAEEGSRTVTCTVNECAGGACVPSMTMTVEPCERETDGTMCEATSCGAPFGTCEFEGHPTCDQSGTRTTTCTPRICVDGACGNGTPVAGSEGCSRTTGGTECAATTCGAPDTCTGFDDFCDASGTASRTCTDFACSGDTCAGTSRSEMVPCTRPSRDGLECAPQSCSECLQTGFGCDPAGEITCTTFACSGGMCADEDVSVTSCTAPTTGLVCRAEDCDGRIVLLCCVDTFCGVPCTAADDCK